MIYILDTDTLSRLHSGTPHLEQHMDRFDPGEVVTTVITRIEILRGGFDFALKAQDGQQLRRALEWLQRSEELLARINILPLDDAAVEVFDTLRENKKLKKIGRADLLIASIALACRATVVTRNLRHFQQVPGLPVENWVD
jgi:tRNA(fMet)-specific endonuclease VapC